MQLHFGDEAAQALDVYRQNLDLSVFAPLPFVLLKKGDRIRTPVDREFSSLQVAPDACLETRNIQTAFALASEGMGLPGNVSWQPIHDLGSAGWLRPAASGNSSVSRFRPQ